MAGSKITPEAIERTEEAFRRHFLKTGDSLTYEEIRAQLGDVGSFGTVKALRDRLIEECDTADEVENFLAPETIKHFISALGFVHRQLRRRASLELAECERKATSDENAHKVDMADVVARHEALESQFAEMKDKYEVLFKSHSALTVQDREQHALIAELKAEKRVLTTQLEDLGRSLNLALGKKPVAAQSKARASKTSHNKVERGAPKATRAARAKPGA